MFCPKCGNKIKEGARFCTKCGNPIGDGNAPMPENLQGTTGVGKQDYRKIIMVATILACVILVAILAIMLMYGKEASNRKQEIDRQHYTIPNQRPKDKHCGKI